MIFYLHFVYILSVLCFVEGSYVTLKQNGPVIIGATITLTADLFEEDGTQPSGTFRYDWKDDALPPHTAQFEGNYDRSVWNITYPGLLYSPGTYEVEVIVSKSTFSYFHWKIASHRININITALLNGEIDLMQNGTIRNNNYVSNSEEVVHTIDVTPGDGQLLSNATELRSYWFINCEYIGVSSGLNMSYNYTKLREHTVKALVISDPYKNPSDIVSNDIGTTSPPLDCPDSSFVPMDPNKTYGYFHRRVSVKSVVHDVVVKGGNWLQDGDILNLTVTCSGSPPYSHCVKIMTGEYNVSGQETCVKTLETNSCHIEMVHYFAIPKSYTLLFIIGNAVSKTVTPFGVEIYEVQKHAQLSVIVVPISCSVLAIALIIFGVAYYIQSKSRYTVEVADFDFSQGGNETEYKTFRERLRDAVSTAMMNRGHDYSEEGGGGGVWSPSRKYGSMQ